MTLPGSSIPQEVALPADVIATHLGPGRLFSIEGLDLYLLPGDRFDPVATAVGQLRESTYREQLSGSGQTHRSGRERFLLRPSGSA